MQLVWVMTDASAPTQRRASSSSTPSGHPLAMLDDQQYAVLRMLAHGHSVEDIAFVLDLAPRDVVQLKYQVMALLELDDARELVAFATAAGLLTRPTVAPSRRSSRSATSRWFGRRRRPTVDEDAPTVEYRRSERPFPLEP